MKASKETRADALELIRSNIRKHGHHIYIVSGGDPLPRYAYTIGLNDRCGAELVLAGATSFLAEDVCRLINEVASVFPAKPNRTRTSIPVGPLGTVSLRRVDVSWRKALLFGAKDFYGIEVDAFQIVPDQDHWTLDIPNLETPFDPSVEPVWQWLHRPWTLPISPKAIATTNLAALRGARVTEAARWEEEEFELFAGAGPDVPESDVRVVPLGTLIGIDPSSAAVAHLDVGRALWRDSGAGDWQKWG